MCPYNLHLCGMDYSLYIHRCLKDRNIEDEMRWIREFVRRLQLAPMSLVVEISLVIYVLLHIVPFPLNPVLHLQSNEPLLFMQSPLGEHGSVKHSLISEKN